MAVGAAANHLGASAQTAVVHLQKESARTREGAEKHLSRRFGLPASMASMLAGGSRMGVWWMWGLSNVYARGAMHGFRCTRYAFPESIHAIAGSPGRAARRLDGQLPASRIGGASGMLLRSALHMRVSALEARAFQRLPHRWRRVGAGGCRGDE